MTREEKTNMIELIKERCETSTNKPAEIRSVKDAIWLWTESESSIVNSTVSFDVYHIHDNNYFVKVCSDNSVEVVETYEELNLN
jgi:hypothetical protein